MWYGEAGKHLADEDIVVEESDSLREDGVIMIEGRDNDPLVEDRVSQDIDQEDLFLGNGEVKEVERDLIGGGVQN